MDAKTANDVLLTGFSASDEDAMARALSAAGRRASSGDPVNDPSPCLVFAAAYDESSLRGLRAAALDDYRSWAFCVPKGERGVVAAASAAREGRMILLPPEERELKRALGGLAEDSRERSIGDAAFAALERLEAVFSWKTAEIDVSRACRRLARFLAEAGFYPYSGGEDECALALEEAFVNSIEHGNLELDSALRPEDPLTEDLYEAARAKRLADPAYGGRLVKVELSMGPESARIVLEDQGPGFDTSKVEEGPTGLDVSGKGFWLIKRPFDEAVYNDSGRRLTLVKRKPGRDR
jgi:anti-sigma regulatory factor (Ser/Thr protein kinase)